MNLSSGYPYNLVRTGLPFDYPKLQQDRTIDVVIMGGGISGALVAYYLLKSGISCLVVDSRTIGLGSTCASTSLLQYEIDEPLSILSQKIGRDKASRAYHLCANAIDELGTIAKEIGFSDLQNCNSIYFAAGKKDISFLQKEIAARKAAGFGVSWADENRLRKEYGLQAYGAIISTKAAQTNAYTLTHALHQYNIAGGMEVYDRTHIDKIVHHKNKVSLTTEDGYRIQCKTLVYATGYEAVKYVDPSIVRLSTTYATITGQFDDTLPLPANTLFWNTADPYLYIRSTSDKRILVGGRDEPYTSSKKTERLIKLKSSWLQKDLARYFPGIECRNEFSWSGIFGSTKDGLPFIGNYPALPHSLFTLGFGGNGITFSVIAAQLICKTLEGRATSDLQLFSFSRV